MKVQLHEIDNASQELISLARDESDINSPEVQNSNFCLILKRQGAPIDLDLSRHKEFIEKLLTPEAYALAVNIASEFNITGLDLSYTNFAEYSQEVLAGISTMVNLQSLDLSGTVYTPDQDFEVVFSQLNGRKNLHLDLSSINGIIPIIKHLKSLGSIELSELRRDTNTTLEVVEILKSAFIPNITIRKSGLTAAEIEQCHSIINTHNVELTNWHAVADFVPDLFPVMSLIGEYYESGVTINLDM